MERLAAGRASCSETGKERSNARLIKFMQAIYVGGSIKLSILAQRCFLFFYVISYNIVR